MLAINYLNMAGIRKTKIFTYWCIKTMQFLLKKFVKANKIKCLFMSWYFFDFMRFKATRDF